MTAPHVELLYIDGCPNWATTAVRLSVALHATKHADVHVHLRRIDTLDDAEAAGSTGSPMIRVNDVDPFTPPGQHTASASRVFRDGPDIVPGPNLAQLADAILNAMS